MLYTVSRSCNNDAHISRIIILFVHDASLVDAKGEKEK